MKFYGFLFISWCFLLLSESDVRLLKVLRPTATAYVHIYEQIEGSRDLEILSLDTATSEDVNVREHPINADHYRLEIFITKRLRVGATYAVTLDRGAVVGKQSCTGGGAPFAGLTDRTMWTFTTNDEGL